MKGIKILLFALLIALYTSSWWACARWGGTYWQLWVLSTVLTFFFVIVIAVWISDNWEEKNES